MHVNSDSELEKRVLIVAPTARDGDITRRLLREAGIACQNCTCLKELNREVPRGAGAILLTEEILADDEIESFIARLKAQPSWSALPIVFLIPGKMQSGLAAERLAAFDNVTLLERPAATRSVVSAVQTAVRGRERQYQIRDQIDSIRQAEARARRLQEQLEIVIEASELGTFHCEIPLDRLAWNDRCKAHFWLDTGADVDLNLFYSILHPDDREPTRRAVDDCVYGGKPYDVEYRTVSPAGKVRWVRAMGQTYYSAAGQPLRFVGITQDITEERKRGERRQRLLEHERAARQEAERVSHMKDEFLATLSHELRTPLNAIFGWTQILRMGSPDSNTLTEGVTVIDRNVRVQMQLIEDLLDMSRIISGKVRMDVQLVDLPEIVRAAVEGVKPAAQAKQVRLETIVDPMAGPVSGDPGRLQQVLWNLLTNAIKFTPKGGRIQVLAERVGSHVEVSVSDTGEGISPDFLPYLFERFSQADGSSKRKHGGLGLGLSIVKTLAELHGGTVEAQSAGAGQGATFTIRLPLRATHPIESGQPHPRGATSAAPFDCDTDRLEGLKVLVIDDERDARELIQRFLAEYGATAALAGSASEAEALLERFQPDVIVSDVGMPERDGYDFIRTVRNQGLRTPAVALTAFARAEDRIRSIHAGYQMHLPKPVEPAELMAVIASLAGR